jgi:YHS domain-containing protein
MNKRNLLIVLSGLLAAMMFAGCNPAAEEPAKDAPAKPDATVEKTSEEAQGGGALVVDFTNEEGRIVCPVMGSPIADKAKAAGHADHDGKRYHFCCDGCPEAFAKDPEKYADGKALAPPEKVKT